LTCALEISVRTTVGVLGIFLVDETWNADFTVITGELANTTEHIGGGGVVVMGHVGCVGITELLVAVTQCSVGCIVAVTEHISSVGVTE